MSLRGRWFQLLGVDNAPRRLKRVEVREHLDGRIELWSKDRALNCEALPQRPAKSPRPTPPPLAERVAEQTGPAKPATTRPWRQPATAG